MGIDMKIYGAMFILVCMFLIPAIAMGQEPKKTGELNLDKIADDLKFANGVQLIQLKQYDKAIEVLNEYLEIFNDGIHRHEAFKHIGDIYFNKYDYQKAIRTYRQLYEEFSTADDGVTAYFKIGICYTKMGYDNKAEEVFQQIIEEYPDSEIKGQAEVQISLLNLLK
jgi:TolA-binding protein